MSKMLLCDDSSLTYRRKARDESNRPYATVHVDFRPGTNGTKPDEWDESQWRAYQREMRKFEAEARAAGFATLDEYLDVQMRAVEEHWP